MNAKAASADADDVESDVSKAITGAEDMLRSEERRVGKEC